MGDKTRPPRTPATTGSRSGRTSQRSTCWSVIVQAQGSGPEARQALEQLIRRYQGTVAMLIRARGCPWDHSPEDLKQEFFVELLRRGDVSKLDRDRGRFRDWLRKAVQNFMHNQWEAWLAKKRGNRLTSPEDFQVTHEATPEQLFLRQFAEETVLVALQRHREEAPDKARFDRYVRFLPGPQLDLDALAPLAAELGIPRSRLAVQIHHLRERHKRILREVVADTLDVDPNDPASGPAVALEMRELWRALCELPQEQVRLEKP